MEDTFIVHATTFLLLTNKTLPRCAEAAFSWIFTIPVIPRDTAYQIIS